MMEDEAVNEHAEEIAVVVATEDAVVIAAVAETAGAGETARERTAMEKTSSSTVWLSRVVIVTSGRLTLVAVVVVLLPILPGFNVQAQAKAMVIEWTVIKFSVITIQS